MKSGTPDEVALQDQAEAAADELDRAMKGAHKLHPEITETLPLHPIERARLERWQEQTRKHVAEGHVVSCGHIGAPMPFMGHLRLPGLMCCLNCTDWFLSMRDRFLSGDQCDLCGKRGVTRFREWVGQIGPAMVYADFCLPCAERMQAVQA